MARMRAAFGGGGALLLIGGVAAAIYFAVRGSGATVKFGNLVWDSALAGPFQDPTGGVDFYTIGVSGKIENSTPDPVVVIVALSAYSQNSPISLRTGNSGDIFIGARGVGGFAANVVVLQSDTRGPWVRRIVLIDSTSAQDFQAVSGPNFNF